VKISFQSIVDLSLIDLAVMIESKSSKMTAAMKYKIMISDTAMLMTMCYRFDTPYSGALSMLLNFFQRAQNTAPSVVSKQKLIRERIMKIVT